MLKKIIDVYWPKDLPRDCMNPEKDCIVDDLPIRCNPCMEFTRLSYLYHDAMGDIKR